MTDPGFFLGFVIGTTFGLGVALLHGGKYAQKREGAGYTRGYQRARETVERRYAARERRTPMLPTTFTVGGVPVSADPSATVNIQARNIR